MGVQTAIRSKPLQSAKFVGILLSLVLGIGGFLRLFDARALIGDPILGDGQFLALLLIPLVSLGLVVLVTAETVVAGYRVLRAEASLDDRIDGRAGYLLLRGVEAGIAVLGVALMAAALPPLFAEGTPAPAGVGIMLLLLAVGIGILLASFVRSGAELFVFTG